MAKLLRQRLILRSWGRRWCEGLVFGGWVGVWGLGWCLGVGLVLVFYSMLSINMPRMTRAIPMNWVVEIFSL